MVFKDLLNNFYVLSKWTQYKFIMSNNTLFSRLKFALLSQDSLFDNQKQVSPQGSKTSRPVSKTNINNTTYQGIK